MVKEYKPSLIDAKTAKHMVNNMFSHFDIIPDGEERVVRAERQSARMSKLQMTT